MASIFDSSPHVPDTGRSEERADEIILQALDRGQLDLAIDQLYRNYKQYMYAVAYRILGDSYLAEDIVQDVFFTLSCRAFPYQRARGSVKSWLQVIVRNRAIDSVRSMAHKEYQFAHLQEMNGWDPLSEEPEMWQQIWGDEQSSLLHEALARLPLEQRRVIELNYFSDATHSEIAAQLQLPLGTVKGRIRLGLQKAKQLLQASGVDECLAF